MVWSCGWCAGFEVKKRNYNNIKLNLIADCSARFVGALSLPHWKSQSFVAIHSLNLVLKLRYLNQSDCVNWPIEKTLDTFAKLVAAHTLLNVQIQDGFKDWNHWMRNDTERFQESTSILSNVTLQVAIINGHLSESVLVQLQLRSKRFIPIHAQQSVCTRNVLDANCGNAHLAC